MRDTDDFADSWNEFLKTIWTDSPDIIVLPELPFAPWFCGAEDYDEQCWSAAVRRHQEFMTELPRENVAIVYSAPVNLPEGRRNQARITASGLDVATHTKRHLPNEAGYWEAHWYDPGEEDPHLVSVGEAKVGVRLCTEMWNFATARRLGAEGADIIAIPRTTPIGSRERWICGGRAAAISAGAYCLSSNRAGPGAHGEYAGAGWIIDPDGEIIAVTCNSCPIVTCEIDLAVARRAKDTYPRYAIPQS